MIFNNTTQRLIEQLITDCAYQNSLVETLTKRVDELEKRLFNIEYPFKYDVGDRLTFFSAMEDSRVPCTVIKRYNNSRFYHVHHYDILVGKSILIEIPESALNKHDDTSNTNQQSN